MEENGRVARISHALTIYCLKGQVEKINTTIPYGEKEMPGGNKVVEAYTTSRQPLETAVHQTPNQTIISVRLPEVVREGEDSVVILKYWIHDLPGDRGISRPVRTLMDRILGGEGSRLNFTYRPGIFERVDELVVIIYPLVDHVPVKWSPDAYKDGGGPGIGRVGLVWHLTSDIPRNPRFSLISKKPSRLHAMILVVGLVVFVAAFLIGFLYFMHPLLAERKRDLSPETSLLYPR